MDKEVVKPVPSLGIARLVALIFVSVSGGAYGTEGIVSYGAGGLWMFLACIIYPIFWGLPVALAVAELACALPTNAAVIGWVNCCLPQWCTCCMGLWTIALAIVDNSLYPAFFYAYLESLCGEFSPLAAALIKIVFTLFSCLLNIIGVDFIGSCSVLLAVNAVLPFAVLSLWGIPTYKPKNWFTIDSKKASFSQFIGAATWNFTGYDQAGHVAAEISNPGKIFSKAVWIALFLPSIAYALPFMAGLSVTPYDPTDEESWADGSWTDVAETLAGKWLMNWLGVGALLTSISYMLAYICTTSRALQLTSQLGVGPRIVSRYLGGLHRRFGTPHVAVVSMSLLQLPFCIFLELDKLLALDAIMYSLKVFGIVASFCLLRVQRPYLHRPYKMFGNKYTLSVQFGILVLLAMGIIVFCSLGNTIVLGITLGVVFGIMFFSIVYTKCMRPDGYTLPDMVDLLGTVDKNVPEVPEPPVCGMELDIMEIDHVTLNNYTNNYTFPEPPSMQHHYQAGQKPQHRYSQEDGDAALHWKAAPTTPNNDHLILGQDVNLPPFMTSYHEPHLPTHHKSEVLHYASE